MRQHFRGRYSVNFIQCLPVRITVVWDVEQTYRRHSNWGTDRARIKLAETFQGYIQLTRQYRGRRIRVFHIIGPSPCCPGRIETSLERGEARMLLCDRWAQNCRMTQVTTDPLKFKVVPEDDTVFNLSWDETSGAQGGIDSSNVYVHPAAVKPPRFKRPGILETIKGGTFRFSVKGPSAITLADLTRGLKTGVIDKVFPISQATRYVMGEMRSVKGTVRVTIRLEPEETQVWQVTVRGWEIDSTRPAITPKVPVKGRKWLPVSVRFDWKLTGRFTLEKVKGRLYYKHGQVTRATYSPTLLFKYGQYYRCDFRPCPPGQTPSSYTGAYLGGKVTGGAVKLNWYNNEFPACLWCRPRKSFLGKVPYRQRFAARNLFHYLRKRTLPLKSGYRTTGRVKNWLRYRLELRRLK
jgi:hypothetical protein